MQRFIFLQCRVRAIRALCCAWFGQGPVAETIGSGVRHQRLPIWALAFSNSVRRSGIPVSCIAIG